MVGKTRLAAAVVKDLYPDRPILIPDNATALVNLDEAGQLSTHDQVIWLDDLERYLSGGGLTVGLILRLTVRNSVVATLRTMEWDRFQPTDQSRLLEWDLLGVFEMVRLTRDSDQLNEEDLARAVPNVEVRERIKRIGIGEYVGAAQHITDQLALGAQSNPLGYALVRGAVDWKRAGLTRPVPADLLPALAAAHLSPRQRVALAQDDEYKKALDWATREINPTVSLLEPGDGVFTVYDYALDQLSATKEPPSDETWQLIIQRANPEELNGIGFQAAVYRLFDVAELSWHQGAEAGDITAMNNLGNMLRHRDTNEAESWYRWAAEAGDTSVTYDLGILLHERGDLDKAEIWYQRAVDNGETLAMYALGCLHQERGDFLIGLRLGTGELSTMARGVSPRMRSGFCSRNAETFERRKSGTGGPPRLAALPPGGTSGPYSRNAGISKRPTTGTDTPTTTSTKSSIWVLLQKSGDL